MRFLHPIIERKAQQPLALERGPTGLRRENGQTSFRRAPNATAHMKRGMNSSRLEERDQGVAIRPVFGLDVVDVSVVNAMLGYVGDTDGTALANGVSNS